jgi:hypothetical protein
MQKDAKEALMISVLCQYSVLSELPAEIDLTPYNEFVKPIDYDFSLEPSTYYQVIGFVEWKGTPWMYVTPRDRSELQIVPAIMFLIETIAIPLGYVVRMTNSSWPCLEILPQKLSEIDNWFERYIDGDEEVLAVIEALLKPA